MKTILSLLILFFSVTTYGQKLQISVEGAKSKCFDSRKYQSSKYKKSIEEAFVIMNAVFNAPAFKDKLKGLSFPCENRYGISCNKNGNPVTGKEIMDSLYKELSVKMAIHLKRRCWKKLGYTEYHEYKTTACFENITGNMNKLPVSYALAVNLCHEYMHHIGFYHSDYDMTDIDDDTPNPDGYNNDIAYRVGWDVYTLLTDWHINKVKIDGLE